MLALDYQNACGVLSQLIHGAHLAARRRTSTWRPF